MVEILTRGAFDELVKALDLPSAMCTYRYRPNSPVRWQDDLQVWALSDEDFGNLSSAGAEDIKVGWYYDNGSNAVAVNAEFNINGQPIKAWNGSERISWCLKCDYSTHSRCAGTDHDKDGCYASRKYSDLISYLRNEIGVNTTRMGDVCVCATSLAKQNGMKMSELFQQYLG